MLVFAALLFPAHAAASAAPRVIVVLCDALTLDDFRNNAYPHLFQAAETGAVGLMNCTVAGPRTDTAATLTIAAGRHVPAEPTDAQAANGSESVAGEQGNAREVYARRVGATLPDAARTDAGAVFHLGIAALARRGLAATRLGAALAQANPPVRTFVIGNADTDVWNRRAALLTADSSGVGTGVVAARRPNAESPFGLQDDPIRLSQSAVAAKAPFTVVQLGDTARAEAARPRLSETAYRAARDAALRRFDLFVYLLSAFLAQEGQTADILLVSPRPPAADARHPSAWDRLAPMVAFGPDFPPGLLTSATTRTTGLIANIDIAPTVLALFHVPIPPVMEGRAFQSQPMIGSGAERLAAVARLDFVSALNQQGLIKLTVSLGGFCFLLILGGLIAGRRGGAARSRRFAPALVFTQNLAAAALLAPVLVPPTLLEYGLRLAAWMAVLTVASYLLACVCRLSPPVTAALLTVLLVVGDTLMGQPLLKDSLLCDYPLSGIRYYGVGNEYLGILLGFTLTASFAWLDDRGVPFPPGTQARGVRWALALGWLGLAFVLGWPGWGANAGSLAATGAGFGVGIVLLRGRKPTALLALACIAAGLALAFVFGALDIALARHGGAASHFGATLGAASGGRGAGYLVEIAARKVAMNLRLFVSPWLLLPAAAVVVTLLATRFFLGETLQRTLRRRPWTTHGLTALLAASFAALVFKDSGIVTVTFLAGSACLVVLWYLLVEATPSEQKSVGNGGRAGGKAAGE